MFYYVKVNPQKALTCLKSTIETLEKGVKSKLTTKTPEQESE